MSNTASDERVWTLTRDVGHPHFGVADGPSLPEHDEVKVVPLARAVAAERELARQETAWAAAYQRWHERVAELERQLAQTETSYEGVSADCATETTRAEAAEAERDALKEALVRVRSLLPHIAYGKRAMKVGNQAHDLITAALAASVSKEVPSEPRKDARITVGLSRIGGRVPNIGDDRQLEAVNAAYAVMCDETNLPDDFDAAQSMAMAAINAFRSVSKEEARDAG